ncbi:hypothetical protein JXA40_07135 [bacterium]|nr:hypothetical protein [candidate division CSSED10-310 bacterium]
MKNKSMITVFFMAVLFSLNTMITLYAQVPGDSAEAIQTGSLTMLNSNETVLSEYREKDGGMFSNAWSVYRISEGEENKDIFIELNGKRIGPFERTSDLISFSSNGKQVVFAAKDKADKKWGIYVNGMKKWSYEDLAWATYTWPLGLKGNTIRSQSKAVVFEQSEDNKIISFFSNKKISDKSLWANVVNGTEGRFYENIGTQISFINGKVGYWAWKSDNEKFFVLGNTEYGPYAKAYSLKISENSKHFSFTGEKEQKYFLVVDGKEMAMPGEIESHAIGNDGTHAVSYKQDGRVHVLQNGVKWPKTYDDALWHQFRMTPDAKTLAGWFKQNQKWYVIVNGETEYGPYDSFYYIKAGEFYSLFLGKTGDNVGYLTGKRTFYLNGKKVENGPKFGGMAMTVYQDDRGIVVGEALMGGLEADMSAIADAVAIGAADPVEAKYFGSYLVFPIKKDDSCYVVADNREMGPFSEASSFCASPSGKHLAFIAENQEKKWVVIDGKYQTPIFDELYKLQFTEENEIAFLTVKEEKVIRVSCQLNPL